MKNLKSIIIVLAILGLSTVSFADSLDLDVNVDVQNGQSQYDIGRSGDDTNEYVSTFGGFPGIGRQLAPRALYDPKKESSVWKERRKLRWDELYHNLKNVETLMEKSGDIFQSTSRPKNIGKNFDDVNILSKIPQGINDQELWSFQIQSPVNGFYRETINRAISIAKLVTGTRRVLVLQYGMLNPWNAGNAWGSNNAASWINGGAFAVAPGVQMGKSQSLVYKRQMITVYCYNDGDSSTPVSTPVVKKTSKNFSFLFGPSGINPADPNLEAHAEKLKSIWSNGEIVTFTGLAPNGQINGFLEKTTYDAMIGIGRLLHEQGLAEEVLENKFQYETGELTNKNLLSQLRQRGAFGIIVVKFSN